MGPAVPSQTLRVVRENLAGSETLNHLQSVLWAHQEADGHWHYALDDNTTMNSEYIMFHRWMGLDNEPRIQALAEHLFAAQDAAHGFWNLYHGGPGNLSTTIEAYLALRLAGFPASDPRLVAAKNFILSEGGIPKARVFTRIWLAMFGLFSWDGVPMIPPEIMLAPKGTPFNLYEFSYWSRTTIVPLTILFHLQKECAVDFNVDELYIEPEDKLDLAFPVPLPVDDSWILKPSQRIDLSWVAWEHVFIALNKGVSVYEARSPVKPLRKFCIEKAKQWILSHQEESGDWGGIQPPMLNSIMALHGLGMPIDAEPIQRGLKALERFTRGEGDVIRKHKDQKGLVLQSCVSPIWDTVLGALALLESGCDPKDPRLQQAKEWIWKNRITTKGDWARKFNWRGRGKRIRSTAAWCFQYHNTNYPDVDDSAVAILVLYKLGMTVEELEPALDWIFGMQNSDGGWGTFDRDNNELILNRIPFADLKSLIDPSNPDLTGHVLETLGEMGLGHTPEARRAIRHLKRVQKAEGSWFGRWGVNYLYGTCAAVVGLRKVGEPHLASYLQRAVNFVTSRQNLDGGWGENCNSYGVDAPHGTGNSTPSQTAWALMILKAMRTAPSDYALEIQRGIDFLRSRHAEDGLYEDEFTGTGFPQHFYLRYDGYRTYFPLIALGRLLEKSRV